MQPIRSSVAVDSYAPPRVNAAYRRANGEAPLSTHRSEAPLSALLRPQLVALSDDDVRGIERRMHHHDRAVQRNNRIEERVSRVSAQAQATAEQRQAQLRQRAARHAKVAGELRVKQIQEEYRTMGMR